MTTSDRVQNKYNRQANCVGAREILLRITGACNQNCRFCNTVNMSFKMDLKDVFRECHGILEERVIPIFTGGEPALHSELLTMSRVLREMGYREIGIQTNGVKAKDNEYASALADSGITFAIVSLHSHDSEVSDRLTRVPGDFECTVSGIHNLLSNGINVIINHVINKMNYKSAEHFVEIIAKTFPFEEGPSGGRIEALSLSYAQPVGAAFGNFKIVPRLSEAAPFFVSALRKCVSIGLSAVNPGCGIPVCFTPGFESLSSEYYLLRNSITDVRTIDVNRSAKVKASECKKCIHDKFCLGLWENYVAMYGIDELRPVLVAEKKKGRNRCS